MSTRLINYILHTTVDIDGVVVEAGDTVPLTLNPDGTRNRGFRQQVFTGVYHNSTKRVLRRFKELITESIINHTILHRDLVPIVTSYVGAEVPVVTRAWSKLYHRLCRAGRPIEHITVTFDFNGIARAEIRSRDWVQVAFIHDLDYRMSHEVMVFYLDLLSGVLAAHTPTPLRLVQKNVDY